MKSLHGFVVVAIMIIVFFTGMIIVFDDADKTNLDEDSQALYDSLVIQVSEVEPIDPNSGLATNVNFSRDNPQISDENAFSAEFFTASTSNQNKVTQIDTFKATPQLIYFALGGQNDFGWFYNYVNWYIGFLIVLIGFVILFRREIF